MGRLRHEERKALEHRHPIWIPRRARGGGRGARGHHPRGAGPLRVARLRARRDADPGGHGRARSGRPRPRHALQVLRLPRRPPGHAPRRHPPGGPHGRHAPGCRAGAAAPALHPARLPRGRLRRPRGSARAHPDGRRVPGGGGAGGRRRDHRLVLRGARHRRRRGVLAGRGHGGAAAGPARPLGRARGVEGGRARRVPRLQLRGARPADRRGRPGAGRPGRGHGAGLRRGHPSAAAHPRRPRRHRGGACPHRAARLRRGPRRRRAHLRAARRRR